MNVKFHMNCENTGKIWKISCVRCNFVKFDISFSRAPITNFLSVSVKLKEKFSFRNETETETLCLSLSLFYTIRVEGDD